MNKDTVFFDVDTQYDFISPKGKLHVPGAETILDNISAVRQLALENSYSIVASMDYHRLGNPEISLNPDFKTTFPPHCMAGEPGAERIGHLGDVHIDYIGVEEIGADSIKKLVEKKQFHIAIRTDTVDMFESPNAIKLLGFLQPKKSIVFGVALDVCVYNAVKGLKKYSDTSIYVVKDAVKGLNIISDEQVYEDFGKMLVQTISLEKLKELL
jgi:nicotinamidase/pyrazinamidase